MLALDLLIAQGLLGAFDTLYHHELKEQLPYRAGAQAELRVHGLRVLLYVPVFLGLAWTEWHGWLAPAFALLFAAEIGLTLWDFVIEDRTRKLPASERVTHTLLAVSGGAFLFALAAELAEWWRSPTALQLADHGVRSLLLTAFVPGMLLSGLRDLHAARRLAAGGRAAPGVVFGGPPLAVLVTGGTGFIGRRLVWTLLEDGHSVTLLARDAARACLLFDGRVRAVERLADLQRDAAFDLLVNLAGEPVVGLPWTGRRRARLLASRIETTRALVEWIARAPVKPRVLISASAIGYYGNRDDEPLGENADGQPTFVSELCAQWERAARGAERHGTRVCVLRLGLVFGWGGALPMLVAPHLLGLGARLGTGAQWVSWVHLDDVIAAIAFLASDGAARGAFNVTAPEALTQRDLARRIGRALGRPVWLVLPERALRALAGEMAELFTRGARVVPQRLAALNFGFRYPTFEAALREFRGRVP